MKKKNKTPYPKTSVVTPSYNQRQFPEDTTPKIRVSAIVSTYNSERFIRGCLEDLVNQTLYRKGELEIIVVNSGSQQNEEAVVQEFQKRHPHIRSIRTENRETVYAAWNRGIKTASGKYITNANTDDRHRYGALEIMARELDEHPAIALVYGDQIITQTENEIFEKCSPVAYFKWPAFDRKCLLNRACIGPQPMWRKALHGEFGYFREELKVAGDYEWWLRISEKYPFRHIPELLGLYLVNKTGLEYAHQGASQQESSSVRESYMTKAGTTPQSGLYPPNFIVPRYEKTAGTGPLVSVIIPTYNRPEMLKEAIGSVLNQTYRNFEILVVNDAGADVAKAAADMNREGMIHYIAHGKNRGLAAARNTGIAAAHGKYLAYLDDDDIFYRDHLRSLVDFLESSDYKIAYTDASQALQATRQGKSVTVTQNPLSFPDFDNDAILLKNLVPVPCFMHEKSCLEKTGLFDETLGTHEDWDLWIRMSRAFRIGHVRKITCEFRTRQGETQMTTSKLADFHRTRKLIYERYRTYAQNKPHLLEAQKKILNEESFTLRLQRDNPDIGHSEHDSESRSFGQLQTQQTLKQVQGDIRGTASAPGNADLQGFNSRRNASTIIVTFNSSSTIRACIDSVLRYTPGGEVIVVDNASADKTQSILNEYKGRISTILNTENKGFSFACNQGIRASKGEYVILLNPDTVVTPMWAERILAHFKLGVGAVGPLTNYTTSTQLSSVYAKDPKNWETLKTNERAEKLYAWNRGQGRETKLLVGFCLALPRRVLDEVGLLDENLFLGSEDLELSWRLRLKGYKLIIATDTFIYHEGQVSFRSVEKHPSTKESDWKLYEKLAAHYGEGNVPHPMELWGVDYFKPEGAHFRAPSLNERKNNVYKISPSPSLPKRGSIGTTESQRGTFAAVYCVYDDTTWLRESIESVYDVVDALYFLIGDSPWFGQATDNKTTLEYIRMFPDTQKKIKIIRGTWSNETDQRNKGLDIVKEAGIAYCVVIDADEIYDPDALRRMTELAALHPEVDCWHMNWDTYWKSYRSRIDPREPFDPIVIVKVGTGRFIKNRTVLAGNHALIPPETGICHHLSYARSDAEVLKKITTFSHAHEVKPGWFQKVWKLWDADHSLTDLHPTHPHNYQRAVEQPYSALPPVLRKRYLSDETERTGGAVLFGLTSIIILAHNQWDQTERCLESIGRHTPEPHEIIVVDNNSTDETRTRLQMLLKTIPRLKVISNNTNRGYAAGNNQGLSIARGEYLLLLNNDTVVTPGWLRRMTGVFRRFPKTGVAGPMSNNVTRPQLAENVAYEQYGGIDGFAEKWTKEHEGQSFTTTKASGFCLLTRREVIDTIGGLDEQFGSGNFEDDDFCSRAFLTGFEIRIAQDVFIHHEGSQTFKGAGIDYNAKMLRNWELYKAKWDIPKETPLDRYWMPSRLPETVSHFFPLPDLSSDHTVDPESRWWEDFRKKEEQGEEKIMKKERSRGLTSLILLLSGHSGYARTCVESIQRHTKGPHEILFVPLDASYTPLKWLRKMLKENKNYKLLQDSRGQGFKDSSEIQKNIHSDPRPLESLNPASFESSNPASLSYAVACNKGLAEAKGEYLLILRDTSVVTEEWLSGMREHLNSSTGTGIVGPMTVNVEGRQKVTIQDSRIQGSKDSIQQGSRIPGVKDSRGMQNEKYSAPGTLDSSNPAVQAFARSFRERNRYRRVPVKSLDSFCLLFTHALTEKIGLFDEGFETDEYAADDYCIRAVIEGGGNVIAGDVFIHYYGRQPVPALKDRIAFGKKWSDADKATPASKKVFCANALLLSDELNQKGQREKAVATLIEAIKSYPEERKLGYALAAILIGEKKYKEALDIVTQMPPGFAPDEKRLELLGACTLYLGRNEEADKYADELLLQNNATAMSWNLKGTVAFEKKAYADAERSFQKAISSDRGFGEAYANIGALRWADGKKEEALQLFEKAFILSPVTEDIVTNYYTAAVSLSQLKAAEITFKEAITLYPFNRRLKFVLIDNLLQQGKYPEAMDEMEEALAVFGVDDDTLAVALKLRERLQDSRIQGVKGPSEELKENLPTSRTLESLNPGTLSLCMIVKNEEKNIIRALQNAKPLVDEMIVVDTGSTDRTKKIAKAFGAKVYDFSWTDSFSDARNFSLSKATGDWLLVLDADEVISERDYGKLKELIRQDPRIQGVKDSTQQDSRVQGVKDSSDSIPSNPRILEPLNPAVQHSAPGILEPLTPVSYSFVTRNYVGPVSANWHPNEGIYKEEAGSGWFPSGKVRLFPNDSRIRFEKPVHEVVEDSLLRAGYEIVKSDIPIHHYGKLNTEEIRAKGGEYFELGKKKLAEQGAEDPKALYELAVQASELEKYDEALEFWHRLIAVKPDFGKAYYGMGTSYYRLGRYGEARAAYKKAVEITPGSKDPLVMYATSELIAGDAVAAVSILDGLLRKNPGYPLALLASAAAHFCAGRKKEGLAYARKVQETQFDLTPYLTDIANILISVKRFDYAQALIEAADGIRQDSKGEGSRIQGVEDSRQQGSRIQGVKDSRGIQNEKYSAPGTLESSDPAVQRSTTGTLESLDPGTLSLCMIVRDEEDSIAQALLSMKPVAGEMVVVDTGSTDRTKEIAAELGAKVYDFPWTDSFSDARNFSLSKATGDWILVLDADEVISPLDHGKLRELIQQDSRIQGFKDSSELQKSDIARSPSSSVIARSEATKQSQSSRKDEIAALPAVARNDEHTASAPAVQHSAPGILEPLNPVSYSLVTRTYVTEMNTAGWVANDGQYINEEAGAGWFPGEKVRLFPNDSRIRFEYPLHERVEPSLIKAGFEIRSCDIPVHHYGNFVTSEKGCSKAQQYYQLGQKKIADSGQQNFMAFYELALQGAELGKYEEAIEYLKKTLELKPDFAKAHQSMGNAHYNLGRYGEALPFYRKALALDPGSRDAVMMCATCEIYAGNAAKAVALLEGFPGAEGPSPQILLLLAEAHVCAGRKKQGLEYVKKLRELKLDTGGLFNNFAKILISAGRRDYALSILDAAVEAGFATEETRELLDSSPP